MAHTSAPRRGGAARALVMAAAPVLLQATRSVSAPIDCTFASSYPRQYVSYQTPNGSITLDGRLDEPAWTEVPFTQDFVDISTNTTPKFRTQAKIRWDLDYLYVGALLQDTAAWANITHTCHCIDPVHDQVIYHDNDFEVFVDADGSTHMYKETEVNVLAQSWDLLLNKPYNDGGGENSSRVYGPAGWDMYYYSPPLRVSSHADARVNDPTVPHAFWTVEIALPLKALAELTTAAYPPVNGTFWRINFSRVEWGVKVVDGQYQKYPSCQSCPVPGTAVEDNWVWSPQGSIAMHLPDKWGMLQFSTAQPNMTSPVYNQEWPARSVAMELYYAQHAYASAHNGSFTSDITALYPYADPHTLDGTCTGVPQLVLSPNATAFNGSISYTTPTGTRMTAHIRDDRYLLISYP